MSDKHDPDDTDSLDDHGLDSARYGGMSRPPVGRLVIEASRHAQMSLGWLKARQSVPSGLLDRTVRVA